MHVITIHKTAAVAAVRQSVRLESGRLGFRIPAATDLNRPFKTDRESSIAKRSAIGVSVTSPRK